ncbi:MAG TPA: Tat pathway signal protein [Mariniphaga anaerophila]|uniref:Tat pathway signal protein n=1 Tax=Mariniphaga anaerophila TaxID=1484053 RepID=A0A831LK68_9BACT|nr:Tat pathway signal protein [Mariniphaga anaerophila]
MDKREFIKKTLAGGAGLFLAENLYAHKTDNTFTAQGVKHWAWERPNARETENELKEKYSRFFAAGIRGVFFESDSEKHFRAVKAAGMESHRWMWTLNRGEKTLLDSHPEWYAVSRHGKSCATDPPYVNYYRWLCPSRPEVAEYLKDHVGEILEKDYVDGIHLDYVRYSDVVLPVNLWDNYGIEQTKELPEYDFCYCSVCREKFQKQSGMDVMNMEFPDQSLSWRNYRYNQVTNIVNQLSEVAAQFQKPITAAVFPAPEVARRIVRQDWTRWKLDAVFPMIYHGFYKEPVNWIGDAVAEGLHFLCGKFPLYAGVFLPDFKSAEELEQGMKTALKNGASGISFFGNLDDKTLTTIGKVNEELGL